MQLDLEKIYQMAPFARTLGVTFPLLTASEVHAELSSEARLSTLGGGLHGGAIMSVSDLAAAVCVGLNLPEGRGWTTAQSASYFLRPIPAGDRARAVASPIKLGRGLVSVEVDVFDAADRHCARTTQLVAIQPPA